MRLQVFRTVLTGEVRGGTTAAQLPDVPCSGVIFKAPSTNATSIFLGVEGVTKPNGTTSTTAGFELDAGDESQFIPVDNLNKLWMITDVNGDDLTYMAFR